MTKFFCDREVDDQLVAIVPQILALPAEASATDFAVVAGGIGRSISIANE